MTQLCTAERTSNFLVYFSRSVDEKHGIHKVFWGELEPTLLQVIFVCHKNEKLVFLSSLIQACRKGVGRDDGAEGATAPPPDFGGSEGAAGQR